MLLCSLWKSPILLRKVRTLQCQQHDNTCETNENIYFKTKHEKHNEITFYMYPNRSDVVCMFFSLL